MAKYRADIEKPDGTWLEKNSNCKGTLEYWMLKQFCKFPNSDFYFYEDDCEEKTTLIEAIEDFQTWRADLNKSKSDQMKLDLFEKLEEIKGFGLCVSSMQDCVLDRYSDREITIDNIMESLLRGGGTAKTQTAFKKHFKKLFFDHPFLSSLKKESDCESESTCDLSHCKHFGWGGNVYLAGEDMKKEEEIKSYLSQFFYDHASIESYESWYYCDVTDTETDEVIGIDLSFATNQ